MADEKTKSREYTPAEQDAIRRNTKEAHNRIRDVLYVTGSPDRDGRPLPVPVTLHSMKMYVYVRAAALLLSEACAGTGYRCAVCQAHKANDQDESPWYGTNAELESHVIHAHPAAVRQLIRFASPFAAAAARAETLHEVIDYEQPVPTSKNTPLVKELSP